MIAVDTSAIIAILRKEDDESRFRTQLEIHGALMSAGNVLELQFVTAGKPWTTAWPVLEAILQTFRIVIHPFDDIQLGIAREAAVKFGRGRHKAALNFGDCFAYALAKSEGLPLLCKGTDFAHTDVKIA